MLKTLALGGRFDVAAKKVVAVQPALGFADVLYGAIKDELVRWAVSNSSFVVVNMLDVEGFTYGEEVKAALKKAVKELQEAAEGGGEREAVGEGEGGEGEEGGGGREGEDEGQGEGEARSECERERGSEDPARANFLNRKSAKKGGESTE
ncbi:Pumilio y domain member 6 [Cryomyces antarcticus]|uniref:Pumilio y domain member 6 n=1 Tax=Cryomyces antarcticus TaxID=329879 RepID=A0ABR0M547_9PEZI|nr:Pumilio y domain member 6 [Cryomyces antarcticus]KAK5278757.1 Pumilio y domain member 6 [Cryomyces antarcticus]